MKQAFPAARMVDAGGVRLAVYEAGEGPPVILVHGWPEIAWSWKNQIGALADAGFRAIALDLKGFGASDAPRDPALYDIWRLTDDLVALLDALALDRAVFCGHDWGGAIVWPMAQLHPDRVAGVIGVSTPHRAPPPVPPLQIIEKRFGAAHYFIGFQEEGVAEALFATDVEKFFRLMFRRPAPRAAWPRLVPGVYDLMGRFRNGPAPKAEEVILGADDLAVYVEAYRRSGFHGGVNLYRNIDRNYALMRGVDPHINVPALFVGAELDLFLPPETAEDMPGLIPDLEMHVIPGCGHWVMWEQPDELNALMLDWLVSRFRNSPEWAARS